MFSRERNEGTQIKKLDIFSNDTIILGCYATDGLSFMWRLELHTWNLSENTQLQVRLLRKKCGNAVPTHYTPGLSTF